MAARLGPLLARPDLLGLGLILLFALLIRLLWLESIPPNFTADEADTAVFVYNGEELGLPNVELPDSALRDPVWERSGHTRRGRDASRVPMPWEGDAPPFGFSSSSSYVPSSQISTVPAPYWPCGISPWKVAYSSG